jgi:hypothetical protein
MSTIKPTTSQAISMRQQVLDNASAALGKQPEGPSFSERMGGAVREVADAQVLRSREPMKWAKCKICRKLWSRSRFRRWASRWC